MLFFLLHMLYRSNCHQVSNQADKFSSGDYFIVSRRFAHLFKWASSGQKQKYTAVLWFMEITDKLNNRVRCWHL